MGGSSEDDVSVEIPRMQAGVRACVARVTGNSGRGLRELSPPALLSLLCAAAFAPLVVVGAGITGAAAVAGLGVLSSVGSGALTGVLTTAIDRLSKHDDRRRLPAVAVESHIARRIELVLAKEDQNARALRADIAAVLAE